MKKLTVLLLVGAGLRAQGFGTVVASYNFTSLTAMSVLGITYRPSNDLFYFVNAYNLSGPNNVYSFDPDNPLPTLFDRDFNTQNFFGNDFVIGIAWDADSNVFWLAHADTANNVVLAAYDTLGQFTGDTWRLSTPVIMLDWRDGTSRLLATTGGGYLKLDPWAKTQTLVPGFGIGMAYLANDTLTPWLLTTGADTLLHIDTLSQLVEKAPLDSCIDLDVRTPLYGNVGDSIFAFVTTQSVRNTVYKVYLGTAWAGVGERKGDGRVVMRAALDGVVSLSGPLPHSARLTVFDVTGRVVATRVLPAETRSFQVGALPRGVYTARLAGFGAATFVVTR